MCVAAAAAFSSEQDIVGAESNSYFWRDYPFVLSPCRDIISKFVQGTLFPGKLLLSHFSLSFSFFLFSFGSQSISVEAASQPPPCYRRPLINRTLEFSRTPESLYFSGTDVSSFGRSAGKRITKGGNREERG